MTKYYVNTYYKPAPAIDGFYMDNTFIQPQPVMLSMNS